MKTHQLNSSQLKLVDAILESLDNDIVPWNKPWSEQLHAKPRNGNTGTLYKGYNQILLTLTSNIRGFKDPRWCTYNQAKENNWQVKKGAKSVQLFYPLLYNKKLKKFITAEDFKGLSPSQQSELKSESVIRLKYFNVFNGEEIIGIPVLTKEELEEVVYSNDISEAISRNILESMQVRLIHEGDQAYYRPYDDSITMPDKQTFKSEALYYGTLFHEMAHATGAITRLNRGLSLEIEKYSEEELVAEFTSIFLSQDTNIYYYDELFTNNQAYIQSWANTIRNNPEIIQRAIMNASQAYQFLYEIGKVKDYSQDLNSLVNDEKDVPMGTLRRDVLITEYASQVLGLNLVSKKGNLVSTQEHDSLIIYTDKNDFYRYSTATGGGIIEFVMHMEDTDYETAVERVQAYHREFAPAVQTLATYQKNKKEISSMELPEPALDNKKVIKYLTQDRAIPLSIVNDFIEKELLFQDKQDNCVFVGKLDETALYATRRSSNKNSNFKADVASSYAEVGVFYKNNGDTLVLTEGVIDTMSLIAIQSNNKEMDYLSVNGVAKAKGVLNFHMKKREEAKNYDRIIIAFDNDRAGEEMTNELIDFIKVEYPGIEINHAYPETKDWNDELMLMAGKFNGLSPDENRTKAHAEGMSQ